MHEIFSTGKLTLNITVHCSMLETFMRYSKAKRLVELARAIPLNLLHKKNTVIFHR